MSKKKIKLKRYKLTRGAIDVNDAALKAIRTLDIAGLMAQEQGDAQAMAMVASGWVSLSATVFGIQNEMSAQAEIADMHSDTEIAVINKTGFSPNPFPDEEEDEDDED